jgi:hypothetical protein
LNGSKFSKSKNVQYIVCPTFSELLKTFLTTWYTKGGSLASFQIFWARFDDFNIYYLLNQQIITIIGKLGQKIPKLHTSSWFGSIRIPKKFQMIPSNWYYASHIGIKISRLVTMTHVRPLCFSGDVHNHFLIITWKFFDNIIHQNVELMQIFRFLNKIRWF